MRVQGWLLLLPLILTLLPFPSLADSWPPGPRLRSVGPFIPERVLPVFDLTGQPVFAPLPECPAADAGQPDTVAGFANGMTPAVVEVSAAGLLPRSGAVSRLVFEADTLIPGLPGFMRDAFLLRISQLDPERQQSLAKIVAEAPAEHRDEMAFLVAHLSREDLTSPDFDPWLLTETPLHLYEAANLASGEYLALVDRPDPDGGSPFTTVRLRLADAEGAIQDVEVPRDIYYWYVVHPKLDLEPVQLTIPHNGKAGPHPQGVTWREYYRFTPPEVAPYTNHLLLMYPNAISAAELQGWGPSAATVFAGLTVGPLELARTKDGLVLVEYRIGGGTILATTMPVEKAAAQGKSPLLKNLLNYGNGNVSDVFSLPHLVLMDRKPYGTEEVTQFLNLKKAKYQVITSAEFASAPLDTVSKLIVPSDQPRAVYEALAARRQEIEDWIAKSRVFEFHGATAPADDWSDLALPGGLAIAPLDGTHASDEINIGGWPHLGEVMPKTALLWDSQVHSSLSGDRPFDPATFALDKVGWFTSQNLFDNVEEYSQKHAFFVPERSVQAVRVLYNHFGNCGEIQDVITAAARTSLIPMMNVADPNEDHVWNEFWSPIEQKWLPYQVSWSDSETIIAAGHGSAEKKFGGGKDISAVTGYRGDGWLLNRTPNYSDTWQFELTVTDKAGKPVDGALVIVASEVFYPDPDGTYPLGIAFFGYTDTEGKFETDLGDAQNFYVRIVHPVGTYPPEANKVAQVMKDVDALPGVELKLDKALDKEAVSRVPAVPDAKPEIVMDRRWLEVRLAARGKWLVGRNPMSGDTFDERMGDGAVDVYVLDEAAYQAFQDGKPTTALWAAQGIGGKETSVCGPAPAEGPAFLVFAAPEHHVVGTAFRAEVIVHDPPMQPEPGPDAEEPGSDPGSKTETAAREDHTVDAEAGQETGIEESGIPAVEVGTPTKRGGGCSAGPTTGWAGLFLGIACVLAAFGIPGRTGRFQRKRPSCV